MLGVPIMDQNKGAKREQHFNKTQSESNKNQSSHGDSNAASITLPQVDSMTSRDFQLDYNAHVEMMYQMVKDTVRINTFKAAILHNKHLFKNKYVLNVGCGCGIYALFAAKAGASRVFAVDSSNVVHYTRQIVKENGFSNVIEVIQGKIEEIQLPVDTVDIIVSDWMGYALLFQSISDAVIFARDKWLKKPGGLIFPDKAKLYMVALEDTKHKNDNIDWWTNVYGFNMGCLREAAIKEPRCQSIQPKQVISKQFPIKILNLNTATLDELNFRSKFMLPIEKSGNMDAIALYFHVYFTKSHTPLGFSTDPWSPRTNCLQSILFFDQSLSVNEGSLYYGGIEFCSLSKPINLNDIVVNFEMLLGDPSQVDLEVEMSWHFKLKSTKDLNENNVTNTNDNQKGYENVENTKPNITKKITKTDSKKNYDSKHKIAANQNTITCSGLVITTDNLTNTITIGKHNYMCRRNKRKRGSSQNIKSK